MYAPDPTTRLNAALEGRYRIERELGEGGMATVYLAADLRHDRRVAIKVLRPELAAVVGAERFLAEIRTTANLQHPHILPLFDSGEADGFLYYVMPYIEGESLRDRLDRERQLPVDEALGIATAVANALHSAHEQGVVHRDIKPANILLSRGEPLVADFGIALAVSAGVGGRLTETGLSLGTPYYMSPEQATGDQTVGPPSDVFALGCVLYEMLIGEPPYPGSTAQAVLGKIIQAQPVSAATQRASVPANVDSAIRRALEKLPADRFTGARDFAAALADRSFRHGAGATGEAGESVRDWKRAVAGLAAMLAVMSVVAVWGWSGRGAPAAPPAPALRTILDLGSERLVRGGDRVVIAPDGSGLAFTTALGGPGGPSALMVRTAEDLTFRAVPGLDGVEPYGLAFSPDGEWIAYVANESALMKVPLRGGAPSRLVSVEGGASYPDWSDEGWIVFLRKEDSFGRSPESELLRVRESGGAAERLIGAPWAPGPPAFLPDGLGILFEDTRSGRLALYDLGADSVRLLGPSGTMPRYVETGHIVYGDGEDGLWAVPFDLGRRAVTGEPRPLLQGVRNVNERVFYSLSREGTLVYLAGALRVRQWEMFVRGPDGVEEALPLEPGAMSSPRWSPDGRQIAYSLWGGYSADSSQILVFDAVVRGRSRAITTTGDHYYPVWSPDGTRIAYQSSRDGRLEIRVQALSGDGGEEVLVSLTGYVQPLDWVNDSTLLVDGVLDGVRTLGVIDPRAEEPRVRPYLEYEGRLWGGRVSPDGSLVAYHSFESGRYEVYVRSFPEAGAALQVSDRGSFPWLAWGPDGRTLLYEADAETREAPRFVVAARLALDPTPVVVSRDTLPGLRPEGTMAYRRDLHPDGRSMVELRRWFPEGESEEPELQMVVITNWLDELRRVMGEGG